MAQSRRRVYVLMVRKDVANHLQLEGLVRIIERALPAEFPRRESLANVRSYVEFASNLATDDPHAPTPSRELRLQIFRSVSG